MPVVHIECRVGAQGAESVTPPNTSTMLRMCWKISPPSPVLSCLRQEAAENETGATRVSLRLQIRWFPLPAGRLPRHSACRGPSPPLGGPRTNELALADLAAGSNPGIMIAAFRLSARSGPSIESPPRAIRPRHRLPEPQWHACGIAGLDPRPQASGGPVRRGPGPPARRLEARAAPGRGAPSAGGWAPPAASSSRKRDQATCPSGRHRGGPRGTLH
jgi:hypothetical protein